MVPVVALFAACLADPPAVPEVVSAEPLAAWNEKFTRTEGWVGGDEAYSVPLSDKRTLWFFGDTWVGAVRDGKRSGSAMVNNTVGVQDGAGAGARLTFPIRRGKDEKPQAQFAPPDGRGFFWPQGGTADGGRLDLFLAQVEHTKGTGAFAFRQVAQWLAVVENPGDDPAAWKAAYTRLPFCEFGGERKLSFGSAVLRVGGIAYVYGYEERPGRPVPARKLILARAPVGKLADLGAWQFYSGGEWKAEPKELTPLADGLATEFSVSYQPGLKKYALVYTESGLSDRIVARFADAPQGPWSKPVLLYTCPEMKADRRLFTYSAKAHPHLSGDGELVVSYCVNSFDFARVVNDATVYWPKFVRVTLK